MIGAYLPFFRQLDVVSAYEYLERRFNLAVRLFGSASFIVFQVARTGIVLFLPALALSTVSNLDINACIIGMGVLTILLTVFGGMEAVVWTDVAQAIILLAAAALIGCPGSSSQSSGAKRATLTFGSGADAVTLDQRLYASSPETILEVVAELDDEVATVLVVAHDPGMSDLAYRLSGEIEHMPTCAVAEFRFRTWSWAEIGRAEPLEVYLDTPH